MGVWIEIGMDNKRHAERFVTPFVGVWIEIKKREIIWMNYEASLPSWECGLKFVRDILCHPCCWH